MIRPIAPTGLEPNQSRERCPACLGTGRPDRPCRYCDDNGFIPPPLPSLCPPHYAGTVTPWDLQKCMQSSGNAFVDARRTDALEYCYRMKGDLLGDLKKARHCLDEAIKVLEGQQ